MNKIATVATDPFVIAAREILEKPYMRRLVPDGEGGYSASIQEFPGCYAEGDTADEALQLLEDAAASWVAVQLANGNAIREPIDLFGASGKIALRIPRGLHKQVAEMAELEACSVNQFLTAAISDYVGKIDVLHKVGSVLKSSMVSCQIVSMQRWDFDPSVHGPFALPAKNTLMLSPVGADFRAPHTIKEIVHG